MAAIGRVAAGALLVLVGCSNGESAMRSASSEFLTGESVPINVSEVGGPVQVDVGYAFEVGNLDVDFLPGDVRCQFTGTLSGIETGDRSESRSEELDEPFRPIGVWVVQEGVGEITCGHLLGQEVELRVDVWRV